MTIRTRVGRLEAAATAGGCRACRGRVMALRYDPPTKGPALFAGRPVPPVECPACGKVPPLVLTVAPPIEAGVKSQM